MHSITYYLPLYIPTEIYFFLEVILPWQKLLWCLEVQ